MKVVVYADFNCVYCYLVVRVLPGGAFSAALDERLAPGDRFRLSTGPSS